jgi:hypothetical protein
MKTRLMISSAMTPVEMAAGRFLRAPDGHPEGGAVMVDVPETPPAETPPAAPTDAGKSIEDLYDQEFGGAGPDAPEGEGDDGEEGEEEPNDPPEPEGAPKEEKTPSELEERDNRIRQLERELEEARKAAPKPQETPKVEDGPAEAKAPDPADYEFGAADEKFIADHARWHADQRFRELQETAAVEAKIEAMETKWKGAIDTDDIKEAYPDFDEKVTKGADRKDWFCSPTMAVLIKNSDVGPHVAYELASNAAESKRLASLSPEEQLLEFGRLEGRALAKRELAASAASEPAPKRTTNAPPPPDARSRGNGGKFASPQDALYDKMLTEFN